MTYQFQLHLLVQLNLTLRRWVGHAREPMSRFTPLVDGLPSELPFTAPERLERDGRPVTLRLGANESAFGVAAGVREAMAAAVRQAFSESGPPITLFRVEGIELKGDHP